ncbi:hypothetical protein BDW59DRAFT_142670 [Aspergillus cavernicola]|uniref:Uncharacterized protein n=1 Tax=Aspergillus cavernicola TaxID=176166 RepID=A0ABR4IMJ3_9EURO
MHRLGYQEYMVQGGDRGHLLLESLVRGIQIPVSWCTLILHRVVCPTKRRTGPKGNRL